MYKFEISAEMTKLMTNSADGIQRDIKVKGKKLGTIRLHYGKNTAIVQAPPLLGRVFSSIIKICSPLICFIIKVKYFSECYVYLLLSKMEFSFKNVLLHLFGK